MPDWNRIVRERMPSLQLSAEVEHEVISELAEHLEEAYEDARARGAGDAEAFEQALQEAGDWNVLAENITRATDQEEQSMNNRTKSFWLPALITLLAASVSLMVCQMLGMQPRLVWVRNLGMTLYWPWLATLPIIGAAGTYLSRRARGATSARLAAGLSPALVMLVVMCLLLPWGMAIDGLDFFRLVAFGLGLVNWVVIPAIALLLGALPSLWRPASAQV